MELTDVLFVMFMLAVACTALYQVFSDFDLEQQLDKDCCPEGTYELQVKDWDMQEQRFFCIKQGTWCEIQAEYKQMIQQGHNSSTCRVVQVV